MEKILLSLIGEKAIGICFVKYVDVGLEGVILKLSSGRSYKFYLKEILRKGDEMYTLEVDEFYGETAKMDCSTCNLQLAKIELLKRDEWIEKSEATDNLIGENPRVHNWGLIGSAPTSITDVNTVTCGIVIHTTPDNEQLMIFALEYPGLVGFTKKYTDIELFRSLSSVCELPINR